MKNYYIKVNGDYFRFFTETKYCSVPITTNIEEDKHLIEGNFNLRSHIDKILKWERETGKLARLDIIDADMIEHIDDIESWSCRKNREILT